MDVKPFTEPVSAPVDPLVHLHEEQGLAEPNTIATLQPAALEINDRNDPTLTAPKLGSVNQDSSESTSTSYEGDHVESDEDDTRPLNPTPATPRRQIKPICNLRKWGKRILVGVFITLIGLLASIHGAFEVYNHVSLQHFNHNYTRSGIYSLLLTDFTSKIAARSFHSGTSKLTATALPHSDPNEVDIFLTKCENIEYEDIPTNSSGFYSQTNRSDSPVPIIDENFITPSNYYAGNITIYVQATALYREGSQPPLSEVHVCSFLDPHEYDDFLHSESRWREYTEKLTCKVVTIQSGGTTNHSVVFTNTHLALTFIGAFAVQPQGSYSVQFANRVVGKTIRGLKESNSTVTMSCTLFVDDNDRIHSTPTCSIDISDQFLKSTSGSELWFFGSRSIVW